MKVHFQKTLTFPTDLTSLYSSGINCGSHWVTFGSLLAYEGDFGATLGSLRHHFWHDEATLGSLWNHFSHMMMTLWQLWDHFWHLGRLWGQLGITLGLLWGHLRHVGVTLGALWGQVWVSLVSVDDFGSLDGHLAIIVDSPWVYEGPLSKKIHFPHIF